MANVTVASEGKAGAGIEFLQQRQAKLMAVSGFVAGRINTAAERGADMLERGFKFDTLGSAQGALILRIDPCFRFIQIVLPAKDD